MSPVYWHWWTLAGVCLLIEALTPGFVFLWLGISAGLTGFLLLAWPGLAWQVQLLAFAALSLASVALWLRWWRRRPRPSPSGLNRRAEACIGQAALLETALVPGRHGRVRLGDTTWAASGPELPAGARVRVVAASGTVLTVEPLPAGSTPP